MQRVYFYDGRNIIDSYLPDFYLPSFNIFIEVKGGYMHVKDKKLESLYLYYPNYPIKVADGEAYKKLAMMCKDKISMWEGK